MRENQGDPQESASLFKPNSEKRWILWLKKCNSEHEKNSVPCRMREAFMQDKLKNIFVSTVFLLVVLGVCGPCIDLPASALDKQAYKNLKQFNEVLDMVQRNYVEPVEQRTLIQGAINGMMRSLDPHSSFMTADMYKELEVETRGSFGGIGIEITIFKDILTVVSPIEDTPAFKAGIKAGDQIIKIDGKSTKDITIIEAVGKLRGQKDTKVTLTIMRESLDKPMDFVIVRSIIQIKSVRARMYDGRIGYVRIAAFQEKTLHDLKAALKDLDTPPNSLKGLVLDLRNNPGGLLNQAVEISDVFLKSGVIVSTKGKVKNLGNTFSARDNGDEPVCPIVVIVNEGTASAAEIVSGALQDNRRAIIVGVRTFGKGSVQTLIPLEDGAALKLTTAKYYTPQGRSIQAEGIVPDIHIKYQRPAEKNEGVEERIRERDLKGHIRSPLENGLKPDEDKKRALEEANLDSQLKGAIDILKSLDILKQTSQI
jgi:carboxyl-terminal processing protease